MTPDEIRLWQQVYVSIIGMRGAMNTSGEAESLANKAVAAFRKANVREREPNGGRP